MCGLAGLLHSAETWQPQNRLENLRKMIAALVHRGPDAQGYFQEGPIALGHCRLKIIAPNQGQQPMYSASGRYVLVFNGEIFNYIELKNALKRLGHEFITLSDTEVILHLLDEYGLAFAKHLNGQFAMAIWDKYKQQLILARDRLGICPLFYCVCQNQLLFASEIKAFLPVLPRRLTLNSDALNDLFTGWACFSPSSVFSGIKQVEPGCLQVFNSPFDAECVRYWQLAFPLSPSDYAQDTEAELTEALNIQLKTAVALCSRSDVPVGAYLSGGLDSAVLVAFLSQQQAPVNTFSLQFEQKNIDESAHQNSMAEYCGTQHHRFVCTSQHILDAFEHCVWHAESPLLRASAVPLSYLAQQVKQAGVGVVLSGEGADEFFGGYDIFKEAKIRAYMACAPYSKRRPLLLQRLYPYLATSKNSNNNFLKAYFSAQQLPVQALGASHEPRWHSSQKIQSLLHADFPKQTLQQYHEKVQRMYPPEAQHWQPLQHAQFLEIKTLLSGYLLSTQGDRMLMQHSVEGRFPYLDVHLIEWANRLPITFKLKALQEKYLLRKMAKNMLPEAIRQRTKMPYLAPSLGSSGALIKAHALWDYLTPEAINRHGVFNASAVNALYKKLQASQHPSYSDIQAFTAVVSTQVLCQQFT